MSNDQILYCLLIDVPRAKARGGWSYLSPNLTILIHTLIRGTIEWKTRPCHCADGWLLSEPIQDYFSYISIQSLDVGEGFLLCLGVKHPGRVSEV